MDYHQLIYYLIMIEIVSSTDWTKECNRCKCVWNSGKRTADCTNINLTDIPNDLSKEIREIDFSNNPLYGLNKDVFENAELRDVHKLKLQNCSLDTIHKTSFKGLLLLIELDLARNFIKKLDKLTFHDNLKLRVLSLSFNKLQKLEEGLFYNLTHLQRLSINNNKIRSIENNVFVLLPSLQHINLGHNNLKSISYDFTANLPKLNSLNLEMNQWICDCSLEQFRNKTIKENLLTAPIECVEPAKLKGRMWSDPVTFSCPPQILQPNENNREIRTDSLSNLTLVCGVLGWPQPEIDWISNGRVILDQKQDKYFVVKRKIGNLWWNNLTIFNVNYRDRGEYKCLGRNSGGVDERNITVSVLGSFSGGNTILSGTDSFPLIIGLSFAIIIILLILFLLVCCCCKQHNRTKRRNLQKSQSDECIDLHRQADMKKALITDINPVLKPPRVCALTPSVNGGTEVSEVKKNLLDNDDSVFADEESHSLDMELQQLRKSQNLLDASEYHHRNNNPYPPDLLPFPPRITQVSPDGGSSTSTVPDTTRLPPLSQSHFNSPQSPLHSPIYDQINLCYRTLPYSRSLSPFVGGTTMARIPRQGYVTIPRRPRQQSWSSEPSQQLLDISEPLYDNLGLRTTVDGSSVSLNKINDSSSLTNTPKSMRLFQSQQTNCDPIAENEPISATLPRNLMKFSLANNTNLDNRRNSLPSTDDCTVNKKLPPLPPPKPKKKPILDRPLFEDEGIDGTEV